MWRRSRSVPGATFGPVMLASALLLAVPLAAAEAPPDRATDPAPTSAVDGSTESAALAALDFDPWMIGEQALLDARRPLDINLLTLQAGVGSLESRLEIAVEELGEAIDQRTNDETELAELEELLRAYAIGTFVSSDPVYDPHPNAQVEATRRAAPLGAVTEDTVADVQRAAEDLKLSLEAEDDARARRLELDNELQRQAGALARAEQLIVDYEQIVSERADEIERRSEEALELNEQPMLGTARGIRVNVGLVDALESLLVAAEQDGIVLSGWGHRPVEQQIVLRISHCGDSGHAIFDLSAGSCSPPTARPGHSEHELGLAIDFTENGSILNSSSPGFRWLVEHGADYGLINLPSEPWHWSTTGH